MSPIYDAVVKIQGKGGPQNRWTELEKSVTVHGGIWIAVHDGLKDDMDDLLERAKEALIGLITESYRSMHQKFLDLCAAAEITDPEEKAQDEKLMVKMAEALEQAREINEGQVKGLAKKCRDWKSPKESKDSLFVPED